MNWRILATLVYKDLIIEFRGRYFLLSSMTTGILLVLLLGIALDGVSHPPVIWVAGLLWLCILFASSVTFHRHAAKDEEFSANVGVSLAPIDKSMVFYAKWLSTLCFLFVVDAILTWVFFIILNTPLPFHRGFFILTLLLGISGLTGVGTFTSNLATHSQMREVLTPILLFPLCIPLFLAVIRLTVFTLEPAMPLPWLWLEVLLAYLAAFSVLPWLLYEPLLEV